ncbi:putative bifunctional diguanylate cyclase/phosphodiesterase [Quadrisphaera oryzae]|uniref:putative bifunctional diguanylate cyclase/phosphodiesterase n=1 Tax=Quadrisphaera TaxID=317661 RepID=UPI00164833D9|nr:bifunctional diguanylate cyclase/phosphodiesterase [Quadrisphaera sp. RL12-1S]
MALSPPLTRSRRRALARVTGTSENHPQASAATIPVLATAVLLVLPSVVLPQLTTWSLLAAITGQALLFVVHVELLQERITRQLPGWWAEGAAGVLAASALLVTFFGQWLQSSTAMGALQSALLLTLLACGSASTHFALLLVGVCGRRADRRPLTLLAVDAPLFAAHLLALGRVTTGQDWLPPVEVVLWAGSAVSCAAVCCLRPRVQPPQVDLGRWKDALSTVPSVAMVMAVPVLGWFIDVPREAAVLAFLAGLALVTKVALLVRELIALQDSHEAALTDDLTGLPNRRAAIAHLSTLVEGGNRGVAIVLLDLDRFKSVNDALGHSAGDEYLRQTANSLKGAAPKGALLARVEGDAFAIVTARLPLERVLRAVATTRESVAVLTDSEGRHFTMSASAGVALANYDNPGGDTEHVTAIDGPAEAMDLLRRAESALHAAKSERSGVVLHHDGLDAEERQQLERIEDWRRALTEGELEMHFQPQVDIASGRTCGMEALVRWRHPRRGLLYPDAFVAWAEKSGLSSGMTRVVLQQSVREAARWHARGHAVPVSVNLTARDLVADLVEEVAQLLVGHGLPAHLLVLEVTETSLVEDLRGAAAVVRELRQVGVHVSIDDFGTGFSSLALLLNVPFSEVKIDRSFVARLASGDVAGTLVVRSTIELAHELGMRVVAEGVEDTATLALLADLKCDISQGYHHGRPAPATELQPFLVGASGSDGSLPSPSSPVARHPLPAQHCHHD